MQQVDAPLQLEFSSADALHSRATQRELGHDDMSLTQMEASSIAVHDKNDSSTSSVRNACSASSWVSPLCKYCMPIFEHWDHFLQGKAFQLPHFGLVSELKTSAELGCALCTQFMSSYGFQQSMASDSDSYALTQQTLGITSSDYGAMKPTTPEMILNSPEPSIPTSRKGHIEMSPPGEGPGSIENTYRLHLVVPKDEGDQFDKYLTVSLVTADLSHSPEHAQTSTSFIQSHTMESLQTCKVWLNRCSNSHKICSGSRPQFVPTRLVCVEGDHPQLVTGEMLKRVQNYATLSHCWGAVRFLTLTQGGLADFCVRIPSEALPKTFLDAILVCKELGIGYMWIDSLCILQDDPKDWSHEAALMTKVYGNAHVNIAAYGAHDGNVGLFFERSPTWRCRVKVPSQATNSYDCVAFGMHHGSIRWEPLSRRGWAFQERLLPPRTLIFTRTQVFWECHENIACEMFPESYPLELRGRGIDTEDHILHEMMKRPISDLKWHNIIEQYTRRSLTFERDKLVAISGLAREVQLHTNDTYCAGMWLQKLEVQLCWFPVKQASNVDSQPVAPTWSWASTNTQISPTTERYEDNHVYVKIEALNVKPDEDNFGATSTAQLSLSFRYIFSGTLHYLRQSYSPKSCFYTCCFETKDKNVWAIVIFSHFENVDWEKPCYFLPIFSFSTAEDDPFVGTCLRGLILQSSGTDSKHFQRIGLFTNDYDDAGVAGSGYDTMREDFLTNSNSDSQDEGEMLSGVFEDDQGVIHKTITLV